MTRKDWTMEEGMGPVPPGSEGYAPQADATTPEQPRTAAGRASNDELRRIASSLIDSSRFPSRRLGTDDLRLLGENLNALLDEAQARPAPLCDGCEECRLECICNPLTGIHGKARPAVAPSIRTPKWERDCYECACSEVGWCQAHLPRPAVASEGLRGALPNLDPDLRASESPSGVSSGESAPAMTPQVGHSALREATTELVRACETREPLDEVRVRNLALVARTALASDAGSSVGALDVPLAGNEHGYVRIFKHEPLDVERLARALDDVGRWRKHDPQNIQYCRAYAALLAAAYAEAKGES